MTIPFSRSSYLKIAAYTLTVPLILFLAIMCYFPLMLWLIFVQLRYTKVDWALGGWEMADVVEVVADIGGVCGWAALLLLLCNFYKPWKDISSNIKKGCLVGGLVGGGSSVLLGPVLSSFFLLPLSLLLLLMFQTMYVNNLPPSIKVNQLNRSGETP